MKKRIVPLLAILGCLLLGVSGPTPATAEEDDAGYYGFAEYIDPDYFICRFWECDSTEPGVKCCYVG